MGDTFSSSTDGATLEITAVDLSIGEVSFTVAEHLYEDDGPAPGNGTLADTSTIVLTVVDDDEDGTGGGTDSDSEDLLVENVAPVITDVTSGAEECGSAHEDDPITLTGSFTDPGLLDEHDVTIAWDDNNTSTFALDATDDLTAGETFTSSTDSAILTITAVDASTGKIGVSVDHDYATGGIYAITVTVTDDDLGAAGPSSEALAVISGVGLQDGVLRIIGTSNADHVTLNQTGNGTLQVHADFIPEYALGETRDFPLADVDRIFMLLCHGDDHATVSSKITLDTIIDGGFGNDHLNGGGGVNMILGRDGDDHINGGSARDILIGGLGADRIIGNPGRDLITGVLQNVLTGARDSIADEDEILAMQAKFKAASDEDIDAWRVGAEDFFNGLGLEIVDDDGEADQLTGSSAEDWFLLFTNDVVTDGKSGGKGKK